MMKTLEDLGRYWKSPETTESFGRIIRVATRLDVGSKKGPIEISLIRYSNSVGVYLNQAHVIDLDEERAVLLALNLTRIVFEVSS
jgi:hypothetical protein